MFEVNRSSAGDGGRHAVCLALLAMTGCWTIIVAGTLLNAPFFALFLVCCAVALALRPTWGSTPARSVLLGLGAGVIGSVPLGVGVYLLGNAVFGWDLPRFAPPEMFEAIAIAFLAPLFEETIYRGPLLEALDSCAGPLAAVFATAVLFAVSHLDPWFVLGALATGLGLGTLRVAGASLAFAIGIHSGINIAGLIAAGSPDLIALLVRSTSAP